MGTRLSPPRMGRVSSLRLFLACMAHPEISVTLISLSPDYRMENRIFPSQCLDELKKHAFSQHFDLTSQCGHVMHGVEIIKNVSHSHAHHHNLRKN